MADGLLEQEKGEMTYRSYFQKGLYFLDTINQQNTEANSIFSGIAPLKQISNTDSEQQPTLAKSNPRYYSRDPKSL